MEVRGNSTYMIGTSETFTTLTGAWSFIKNAHVADGVFLHLYITNAHGNFSQNFSTPFSLDQQSGSQISIIGISKIDCDVTFTTGNGFTLDSGHSFGLISGLDIFGSSSGSGIVVADNATLGELSNCSLVGFETCLSALNNGDFAQVDTTAFLNCNKPGTECQAEWGGMVTFQSEYTIDGAGTSGGGTCLFADHGGKISAPSLQMANFNIGVEAKFDGIIDAGGCSIGGCNTGIFATEGGRVFCESGAMGQDAFWTYGQQLADGTDLNATYGGVIDAIGNTFQTQIADSGHGSFIYTV